MDIFKVLNEMDKQEQTINGQAGANYIVTGRSAQT